jgi:hypothetical protein
MRGVLLLALVCGADAAELGVLSGSVRLNAGTAQPLSNAIVYLGAASGTATPTNIVLDVRDGVLQPRVQVAPRGSVLVLRNSDPTLHIVRIETLSGTNTPVCLLTQAMPYAGFQKSFSLDGFRNTTLLRVTGGNGEAMMAYIAVVPHPWATMTDAEGRFTLAGIPSGNCKLYVWHELSGTMARDVTVLAGRTTQVTLDFAGH